MVDVRSTFKVSADGTLTVGANKDRWQVPFDIEIIDVNVVVGTAPTGAAAIFDLLVDGTSIFPTGKPTVAISGTEVNGVVPTAASKKFVKGQTVGLSVTQIGSTVAGADADVSVQYLAT